MKIQNWLKILQQSATAPDYVRTYARSFQQQTPTWATSSTLQQHFHRRLRDVPRTHRGHRGGGRWKDLGVTSHQQDQQNAGNSRSGHYETVSGKSWMVSNKSALTYMAQVLNGPSKPSILRKCRDMNDYTQY